MVLAVTYDGPDRRDSDRRGHDASVEVLAERLDNHLTACEEQNQTVLRELREMRGAVQPVIDAYTTGKGIVSIAKVITAIGAAIVAIYAGFRAIKGA